jgi:hypothetical protein
MVLSVFSGDGEDSTAAMASCRLRVRVWKKSQPEVGNEEITREEKSLRDQRADGGGT